MHKEIRLFCITGKGIARVKDYKLKRHFAAASAKLIKIAEIT